jgi:hypothetical protein
MSKRKQALQKMVEFLIRGDSEAAKESLHEYMRIKGREMILGEMDDEEMTDDMDSDMDDDDDDMESDDDDMESDDDDDMSSDDDDDMESDDEDMDSDRDMDSDDDDMDSDRDMESDDDDMESDDDEEFREGLNQPVEGKMSSKIRGENKFKNGGKKTMQKHGNAAKGLDDKIKGKIKFKNGGKTPLKTTEPTIKPAHYNDGRRFSLGTTD